MVQDGDIYTSPFLPYFTSSSRSSISNQFEDPKTHSTLPHHHLHKTIHPIHSPSSLPLQPTLPPNHPINPSISHPQCQPPSPPPVRNANISPGDAYAVTAAESNRVMCVSIRARARGVRRVGDIRVIRSLRIGICEIVRLRCVLLGLGFGDLVLIDA